MPSIQIKGDYTALDAHFDKLSKAPSPKGVLALEGVLKESLALLQISTHVRTGSLRASEKADSDKGHNRWEGVLTAGGASPGKNNPVDYAIYEKARGESHDFTFSQSLLDPMWVKAVSEGFK